MVSAGYLGLHYNLYMGWVRLLMLKHTGIYECECIKLCRDSTVHNSKLFSRSQISEDSPVTEALSIWVDQHLRAIPYRPGTEAARGRWGSLHRAPRKVRRSFSIIKYTAH